MGDNIDTGVNTYGVVRSAQVGYKGEADEGKFQTTFTMPSELLDGSDDEVVKPGTYTMSMLPLLPLPAPALSSGRLPHLP